jgi:hypothetical protein
MRVQTLADSTAALCYDDDNLWQTTIKCIVDVVCSFDRCAVTAGVEQCSAARTNVVFTNSYVDNNSSLVSE